ncbi:MAG: response regulator transcription factor [Anaerolineae bacterium]|nr:response regulator transcription factor [Anaerolineae bacterium]
MSKKPASEPTPIKVIVVDDHPFFRQGVRDVLNKEVDIEVIDESGDGQEALDLLRNTQPDVVLMDVNLPTMNGLQVTQKLKNQCPDINVIILTAYDDEEQIYHAIRIGASAYFAKDVDPGHLLDTVRMVAEGYYVIAGKRMTPAQAEQWLLERYRRYGLKPEDTTFSPLTDREMEILELIIEGLSNKEIAFRLSISQQTVKNHVTSILAKLNLADRTQAAIYALRHGWVRLPREEDVASPQL